jgi:hypothetical protein
MTEFIKIVDIKDYSLFPNRFCSLNRGKYCPIVWQVEILGRKKMDPELFSGETDRTI